MLKFNKLMLLMIISFLVSCNQYHGFSYNDLPVPKGTRFFSINPTKNKAEISAYGVVMGTPDTERIHDEIMNLKESGDIRNFHEHSFGVEGGSTFCVVFDKYADKNKIYDNFKNLSTDDKNTNYEVVSLDKCTDE